MEIAIEIRACGWPTRVLANSAYAGDEQVEAMLEAGALGYYVKGESTDIDMLTAIRTVHEGLPWFSISLRTGVLQQLRLQEEGLQKLSAREVEVLRLVEKGLRNKQIAVVLGRSLKTVKAHLEHVFAKLRVSSRTEACRVAREKGWL
ncbi:MAG: hypothetical protein Fur0022_18950 [Anaerolineales bacterium]